MKNNYKYKYFEQEDDIILIPKTKNKTLQKEQDENNDLYDNVGSKNRVSKCIMNFEKKREQEEYQLRRKEMELDRMCIIVIKEELSILPNDIIDKILRMSGFYIPTVLCWGLQK